MLGRFRLIEHVNIHRYLLRNIKDIKERQIGIVIRIFHINIIRTLEISYILSGSIEVKVYFY